jgi:hypothetical protein
MNAEMAFFKTLFKKSVGRKWVHAFTVIKFYNRVDKFWWKMLCNRSWKGYITWDKYKGIKEEYPILRPRTRIPMENMNSYAML